MKRQSRALFWRVFAVLLAGPAVCGAAPDLSTPDKTWAAVCAALKAQDLDAFRACFYNSNEISRLFMDAYSDVTVTSFRLANVVELIGPQGKELGQRLQGVYTELVASGKGRKTEIKEDIAAWSRTEVTPDGNTAQVIYFKKIKGDWLIDTERSYSLDSADGRRAAEEFLKTAATQTPALKKVITDIQNNKIHTLDELHLRLSAGATSKPGIAVGR